MQILFEYLLSNNVPRETIDIILMFPVLVGFIVAARHIIGIKGFGIYTPLIITLAFSEIGFKYGAIIFILSLLIASLTRIALKSFRMLYLPKMALILSITTLSMFALLFEGVY